MVVKEGYWGAADSHDCSFAKMREKESELLANLSAVVGNGYSVAQYLLDNNIDEIIIYGDRRYPSLLEAVIAMFRFDNRVKVQSQLSDEALTIKLTMFGVAFGESEFAKIDSVNFKPSDTVLVVSPSNESSNNLLFNNAKILNIEKIIQFCAFFITSYRGIYIFAALHPEVKVLTYTWPVTFPDNASDAARTTGPDVVSMLQRGETPAWLQNQDLDSSDLLELFKQPPSYLTAHGSKRYFDCSFKGLNIVDGLRVTLGQPTKPDYKMYVFGPCTVFGYGGTDDGTVASLLQELINKSTQKSILCENHAMYYWGIQESEWRDLFSIPVHDGDYVVMACSSVPPAFPLNNSLPNLKFVNLVRLFEQTNEQGEMFVCANHYSDNGRKVLASALFKHMEKEGFFLFSDERVADDNAKHDVGTDFVNKVLNESAPYFGIPQNIIENYYGRCTEQLADDSKNTSLSSYKLLISREIKAIGRIGSIVMNCNPFTLGHRYLVEQAAKDVLHLFIFVVEEDRSYFPFEDRMELVKQGVEDISNVTVLPSGRYIISTTTFSEYFNKAELQDVAIDPTRDVELFAREIAPTLGISVRFAGEEPFDAVTRQYNEAMARILPQYGIDFVEMPRKAGGGSAISASRVRAQLDAGNFDTIKDMVPATTYRYLQEKFGGSVSGIKRC